MYYIGIEYQLLISFLFFFHLPGEIYLYLFPFFLPKIFVRRLNFAKNNNDNKSMIKQEKLQIVFLKKIGSKRLRWQKIGGENKFHCRFKKKK